MNNSYVDYGLLLNRFLGGELSAEEFQRSYLVSFKTEARHLGEPLYDLLEAMFGDCDAFCTDSELLAENPEFYLDEAALREKAAYVLKQITHLSAN